MSDFGQTISDFNNTMKLMAARYGFRALPLSAASLGTTVVAGKPIPTTVNTALSATSAGGELVRGAQWGLRKWGAEATVSSLEASGVARTVVGAGRMASIAGAILFGAEAVYHTADFYHSTRALGKDEIQSIKDMSVAILKPVMDLAIEMGGNDRKDDTLIKQLAKEALKVMDFRDARGQEFPVPISQKVEAARKLTERVSQLLLDPGEDGIQLRKALKIDENDKQTARDISQMYAAYAKTLAHYPQADNYEYVTADTLYSEYYDPKAAPGFSETRPDQVKGRVEEISTRVQTLRNPRDKVVDPLAVAEAPQRLPDDGFGYTPPLQERRRPFHRLKSEGLASEYVERLRDQGIPFSVDKGGGSYGPLGDAVKTVQIPGTTWKLIFDENINPDKLNEIQRQAALVGRGVAPRL